MEHKNMNEKTDQIMDSLNSCKRATAPGFFYTRLKARMEREHGPINKYNWIFRPVYILSTLVVILAVNVVIIFHTNTEDTDVTKTEKESIQSISSVYNLNYNFIYDTN